MSVRLLLGKTAGYVLNAAMLVFSLSCIYPIVWIMYSSLKSKDEFMLDSVSLPGRLQFGNYYKAFVEGEMSQYFISSTLNSAVTVIAVVVLSFCMAYALSRFRFRGRSFIYIFFIAGMLIPVYGLIVPLFLQFKQLGLYDKFYTLILPYIAIRLPLPIFLLESYIRTIPKDLDEAAYMDGASTFYTMTRILFPLCSPVISTVIILVFLDTWNEFPFSLVLVTNEAFKTLPVGLTNFYGQYTTDYTTLMAAMVLSILPVMLVYLIFYKNIIQGMTAGAVKG
ncbi:carbohydrate ABC transporter permease [Paenibacillus sepulcri]|uniref:Carbohydrate ABC transporter permease n=1 Tax=Paenibacillus sepulcri TaxID=359917 RepID=A0ABS7C6D6_9BACL|nr:carbohydrate ABC transporter permease [Paenibacillus sepulcri]